ncbi:MAG: sodium:solute symporter family protein [Clostridiales bacterium]|nr:sodium:solute symporter family protein [Clostridiales bacterium]
MDSLDLLYGIVIVVFFAMIIGVGVYSRKNTKDVSSFVLGGRRVGPWLTAFSFGATYFSAVIFIGYAGKFGWDFGVSALWIGLGNAFIGSLAAWVILGKRCRIMTKTLNTNTMPDFFGKRYDSKALRITAAIIIFIFMIPYSASVFNGLSYLFTSALRLDRISYGYELCIIVMSLLAATYVILGGYMSTAINDFIQGTIMIVGITMTIVCVLNYHGGLMSSMTELSKVPAANGSGFQGVYSSLFGPEPLNLLGVVILTSLGTWGLPQMVQKFYSIKDDKSVHTATVVSTIFAVIIAGGSYFMGGFGRIFVTPDANGALNSDTIMPKVLEKAVPEVLVAVLVVLVLSASMSTLTSLVLTSSSTITLDVLADNVIKKMDEKKKVTTIRILLAIFVLISMVLAIYSYRSNDIYITKLMSISWGAMAGSFLAPFLYGLFWKGVTKAAVWASFISGVGITVVHMILSNGPLFGHSFKFPTGLPINLASPINAGAFAMLFGLIIVPVVSWISPKLDKKVIDAAFKEMPKDIPARIDDVK